MLHICTLVPGKLKSQASTSSRYEVQQAAAAAAVAALTHFHQKNPARFVVLLEYLLKLRIETTLLYSSSSTYCCTVQYLVHSRIVFTQMSES